MNKVAISFIAGLAIATLGAYKPTVYEHYHTTNFNQVKEWEKMGFRVVSSHSYETRDLIDGGRIHQVWTVVRP